MRRRSLAVANLLSTEAVAMVREGLRCGPFIDGAATAGWSARLVKAAKQLADGPATRALQEGIGEALQANSVFANAVLPHRIARPMFLRYRTGMRYGTHVDNAVMDTEYERLRTDVSVTIFLSAPDEYDGGELVIESPAGEEGHKLAAGSALVYPSNTLHRVNEVTRGTRDVAVTWVQSLVRSPARREILFDIERARRTIFERDGKTAEFDLLHKTAANLRRMWVDL